MKDESGHTHSLEVFSEIGFGESFDALESSFVAGKHALEPEGIA
jgi:hypothetical protein